MTSARPLRPLWHTWHAHIPTIAVGAAALNRAHWLHYVANPRDQVANAGLWTWAFLILGTVALLQAATSPWRKGPFGLPVVAMMTVSAYAGYGTALWLTFGLDRVRGVIGEMWLLALLVTWTWDSRPRLGDHVNGTDDDA